MINHRLLIIDDDIQFHQLVKEVGELCGYVVKTSETLDVFRDKYEDFKPTLIFLDLGLAENDGIEVLRFLSEVECKSPIVVISANDEKVLHIVSTLGKNRGLIMEETLQKPVDIQSLKTVLDKFKSSKEPISVNDLKKAINEDAFILHFQPKVSITTKNTVGAEVLVRWKPPGGELIYPDDFIHLMEESGLIRILSRHVLERTMKQVSENPLNLQWGINLSALDLIDLNLPDEIFKLSQQYQIKPSNLCFEITESAIMGHNKIATDILTRLRIKGYSLSIDDFGTGYSSLVVLHSMPFTEIKIDKSFIIDLTTRSESYVIVKAIIDLARNLNLSVVAEGVETEEAWNILKNAGCNLAQGYLISRPMEFSQFVDFLKTSKFPSH